VLKDPHAESGLAPGDGLGLAFQHLMNPKQAAYYLYTSDAIDAETALRLGLVNEVLPVDELMPRAREIARKLLRMPELGRLMTKQIVRRAAQRRHVDDASTHLAHELLGWCRNVADRKAVTAELTRESLLAFNSDTEKIGARGTVTS
jgi:enoyl-CoA hydratase/carnithine racemase